MSLEARREVQQQLPAIPAKRGRPSDPNRLTPAQRKAKERAKIDAMIESGATERWTRAVCLKVLSSDKYQHLHESTYRRLGELLNLESIGQLESCDSHEKPGYSRVIEEIQASGMKVGLYIGDPGTGDTYSISRWRLNRHLFQIRKEDAQVVAQALRLLASVAIEVKPSDEPCIHCNHC